MYICGTKTKYMKQEIIYNGKTITENTDGTFTAYPSNYSAYSAKEFKTLAAAKRYLNGKQYNNPKAHKRPGDYKITSR